MPPTGEAPADRPEGQPSPDAGIAATPSFDLAPASPPDTSLDADAPGGIASLWLLAALTLGVLALVAILLVRRRRVGAIPLAVPQIVRPNVTPKTDVPETPAPEAAPLPAAATATTPAAAAAPAAPAAAATSASGPLGVTLAPHTLSLTLMAATLAYRLQLTNTGDTAMTDVVVEADLTSAHAARPQADQLADGFTVMEIRHRLDGIAPGETKEVNGEIRLPLNQIAAIRQGSSVLFIPLARFAARCGADVAVLNAVVGAMGPQGGVAPVRIDQGPRIIRGLQARGF
ncbi:hypothetical protein [Paraurantiacibacter namhicola]|uniref:hypothetical protein n=1 Tax=Paraurantiacibacter namhicola TaxID=645517 RepID=UPI0008377C45|nr:hypothetical protein [Paraurantiacibacter namhicola]